MKFHIDSVILWPKNQNNEIQEIPFEQGKINIIHGLSRTGKSSILHVIDYAMGSTKCQIPIGTIRDKVLWFGVKVTLRGETWLIARKGPIDSTPSNDYYFERFSGFIPEVVPAKTNRSTFKDKFNNLLGVSDLPHSDSEKPSPLDARTSFRDLAAFNFLPQHIVANPNTLFFKADTWTHRQKLIRAMPYALGIVDAQYVINERRRDEAQKELESLQKQLEVVEKSKSHWQHEVNRMLDRCIEIGLLEADIPDMLDAKIAKLKSVMEAYRSKRLEQTLVTPKRLHINERFEVAVAKETAQQRVVDELAEEISGYSSLAESSQQFVKAVNEEKGHVVGLEWLKKSFQNESQCVACGSSSSMMGSVISNLETKVNQITRVADILEQNPAFDNKISTLKRNLSAEEKKLHTYRADKNAILAEDEKLRNAIGDIYYVAGKISEVLKKIGQTSADKAITERMTAESKKISDFNRLMSRSNRAVREREVDTKLTELIEHYADEFGALEGAANSVLKLDQKELTIRFDKDFGQYDYLWEVGSGANWMGYHVAAFLGIHEFLLQPENLHLPTLSFLVIDQPSQVYFPSSDLGANALDLDMALLRKHRTEDLQATRRIFEVLGEAMTRTASNLQIIILEHAGKEIWGDIKHTHSVAAWGNKEDGLIPASWQ
jgi:hypothetical protein